MKVVVVVLFAKRANECCRALEYNPPYRPQCLFPLWGDSRLCLLHKKNYQLFFSYLTAMRSRQCGLQCGVGLYSNVRQPCLASPSARWTFRFGSFRNTSVDHRFSAFGFNRESTSRAWYRGVSLDSRPVQTHYLCPSHPECSTVCRHWNILGFPGHA